jgi:hypothetical protein
MLAADSHSSSAIDIGGNITLPEAVHMYEAPLGRIAVVGGMLSTGVVLYQVGLHVLYTSPLFGPMAPYVAAHGVLMIGAGSVLVGSAVPVSYYLFKDYLQGPVDIPAR